MSCGTAYTASVPSVVCCQTPSANLLLASPTSFEMSASASLLTSVGSAWYSACTKSGALPALCAVRILVTSVSPDACFFTVTLICSFLPGPSFHRSTTLSMPGAQVQYVSETGPDRAPPPSSDDEPHAASVVAPSVTARAELTRRRCFVYRMELSPDLGPASREGLLPQLRAARTVARAAL